MRESLMLPMARQSSLNKPGNHYILVSSAAALLLLPDVRLAAAVQSVGSSAALQHAGDCTKPCHTCKCFMKIIPREVLQSRHYKEAAGVVLGDNAANADTQIRDDDTFSRIILGMSSNDMVLSGTWGAWSVFSCSRRRCPFHLGTQKYTH
jgi:hypothetical protein